MLKRDVTQLAVYPIQTEIETLPLTSLKSLYLNKTSEIIYVTKGEKLYGIVCMGEALCPDQKGEVKINKCFTSLMGSNVIKAREIFKEKKRIHKIPIVNEREELVSDYSRWDDSLYVKRNHELIMQKDMTAKVLSSYEAVYLVKPVDEKDRDYLYLLETLGNLQIKYKILNKEQIIDKLTERAICIFLNEDERRGVQCLYGLVPRHDDRCGHNEFRYDQLADERWKIRMATYKSLLLQIKYELQIKELGIKKVNDLSYEELNDKANFLLSEIQKKGVKCFYINEKEDKSTEYGKKFMDAVGQRLEVSGSGQKNQMWLDDVRRKEFYNELFEQEDYKSGKAHEEIYSAFCRFEQIKNVYGRYFNAKDARRVTCYQPEDYIGTIYLLGPCVVIGAFVEDQYTIASYLQKILLEQGFLYKVENCGAINQMDAKIEEINKLCEGDIIIYISQTGKVFDIQENSLERIFEEHHIPCEWVTDSYMHCNHMANHEIADSVMKMIKPYLSDRGTRNKVLNPLIDLREIIGSYIEHKYLNCYFENFNRSFYDTVGAIVMNGNPFSKGHFHLIKYAKRVVDYLIVFIVEEDESLFSFEERYYLIKKGMKEFSNVMVVPSGDFILSKNNFKEYFSKQEDDMIASNAEYDIHMFAEYIAKPLQITHRFAGEEPTDKITRIYNEVMKKMLPHKGIIFEEIPRMMDNDIIISASKVREHLKNRNYDEAFALVPQSTQQYIAQQI